MEELFTGKNKEQFEVWKQSNMFNNSDNPYSFYHWENIPPEMQKGVIEMYYDEKGYYIEMKQFETPGEWIVEVLGKDIMSPFFVLIKYNTDITFKSRLEAFKAACIELDKLLNK